MESWRVCCEVLELFADMVEGLTIERDMAKGSGEISFRHFRGCILVPISRKWILEACSTHFTLSVTRYRDFDQEKKAAKHLASQ